MIRVVVACLGNPDPVDVKVFRRTGKKSVVVSLRLRSDSGTLSGDEAARVIDAVVAECGRRVGAVLR